MVLRSMPASRRRKLSVPSTSSSGSPAENPSVSMRRLAGSRYTRRVCSQGVRCGFSGVRLGADEVEVSDMGAWRFCLSSPTHPCSQPVGLHLRGRLWCVVCQRRSLFLLGSPCMCLFCPAPSVAPSSPWSARRAFLLAAGASAAAPVLAQVEVGSASSLRKLVPAETLENSAAQQYQQMLQQAKAKRALAPSDHPQLQRLHAIAKRLIPHTMPWNDRAKQWRWEVNLIGSSQINAFCMPGGKIAFYTGILDQPDADLVGRELAARAGYQPSAAVSLWQKMCNASGSKQGGLAFLSTHPSGPARIRELEVNVPKVQGLYEAARRNG